jgi:PIN domain nuclease of toxin-antitoxin system
MRLLLDTHTLIFAIDHRERLSRCVTDLLLDPDVERWVSTASLWEIAIKIRKGKLVMPTDRAYYHAHIEALNALVLPVEMRHVLAWMELPLHHGDPFDRLLIAQAREDRLTLATEDPQFAAYDVERIW